MQITKPVLQPRGTFFANDDKNAFNFDLERIHYPNPDSNPRNKLVRFINYEKV